MEWKTDSHSPFHNPYSGTKTTASSAAPTNSQTTTLRMVRTSCDNWLIELWLRSSRKECLAGDPDLHPQRTENEDREGH